VNDDELPTLPENASVVARVRLGLRCLRRLADDPANPYYGPLLTVTLDRERFAAITREWRQREDTRRLLEERPTLQGPDLDLDALAALRDGTLGSELARYFRDNGIAPFVTVFAIETDVDYLCKRYRETHDLFHVITGYATDEPGEMELQAFVLGNLAIRHAALILAFSIPRRVAQHGLGDLGGYLRRLRGAYDRGRRSRELLSVRYESLWERPVSALAELMCAPS
jgi:ubiquinone biosynthesis protein COQ4